MAANATSTMLRRIKAPFARYQRAKGPQEAAPLPMSRKTIRPCADPFVK